MTRSAAPLIAISMGDPAGIGPEVILKAACAISRDRTGPGLVVIGDLNALRACAKTLAAPLAIREWEGERSRKYLPVISAGSLSGRACRPGRGSIEGGDAAYRYIVEACRMARAEIVDAVVTAPINKEWLNRAGHRYPGHSELIAQLAGVRSWRMMFAGEQLRVALATVHIGYREVIRRLSPEGILETIRLLGAHLKESLGVDQPRIGVLGLNPHAGEHGLFGSEEAELIEPAIRRARRAGIDAFGPLAPDTAFIRPGGSFGFDAAVAMYHDQGLIALKTLEFDRAVNITLGLPFIRTSPDHGTAYDIAGQGIANPSSMIAAIRYAAKAARRGEREMQTRTAGNRAM